MRIAFYVFCLLVFAGTLYSQDINNTLGSSGTFTIKDGSTTFFSLSQTDGSASLTNTLTLAPTTDSKIGVILKGANRFLHDFYGSGTSGGNTFLGVLSGNFTMGGIGVQGSLNTAVGFSTLAALTGGYRNSALGCSALASATSALDNSALGYSALTAVTTGSGNSAFGAHALYSLTDGNNSSAFGNESLMSSTAGGNSAFGYAALKFATTGGFNCAFGNGAIFSNFTGQANTSMGYLSLFSSLGDSNTAVGYAAGANLYTGGNNTFLGHGAQPSVDGISNEITLGNTEVNKLRCNAGSITLLSDSRDKDNIQDLALGLDFLMNVRPRTFHWDKREWYENGVKDGSKMKKVPTAGFIAQELDEVQMKAGAEWLNLVLKSNPDRLEATPGNLLPIIVKAIQELKSENDNLKSENDNLRKRLSRLEGLMAENQETSHQQISEIK